MTEEQLNKPVNLRAFQAAVRKIKGKWDEEKTRIDGLYSDVSNKQNDLETMVTEVLGEVTAEGAAQVDAVRNVYQSDLSAIASECEDRYLELQKENTEQSRRIATLEYDNANLKATAEGQLYRTVHDTTTDGNLEIPSSSPVAPYAEINEVLGKTRSTKNLIDFSMAYSRAGWGWSSPTLVDGNLVLDGASNSGGNVWDMYFFDIPQAFIGKQLTASCTIESDKSIGGACLVFMDNKSYSDSGRKSFETSKNIRYTVSKRSATKYLALYIDTNSTERQTIRFSNIQLEEGSVATAYEPYFEGLKTAKPREVELSPKYRHLLSSWQINWFDTHYNEWHDEYHTVITIGLSDEPYIVVYDVRDYKWVYLKRTFEELNQGSESNYTYQCITQINNGNNILLYRNNSIGFCGALATMGIPSSTNTKLLLPLPSLVLRSAGSVHDTYEPSTGKVTRRVGEVDLGSLIWRNHSYGVVTYDLTQVIRYSSSINFESSDHNELTISDYANLGTYGVNNISVSEDGRVLCNVTPKGKFAYELAEPVEEPVSPITPYIGVEAGGTVSVVSDDAQAEASITYMVDLT